MINVIASSKNKILDFFNPQGIKCVLCGKDVHKSQHGFCDKCKKELPTNGKVCQKCGVDIRTMNDFCDSCGKNQLVFDEARSVCRYEGQAQQLVLRLKFAGQKYLSKPMAHMMAQVLHLMQDLTVLPSMGHLRCARGAPVSSTATRSLGASLFSSYAVKIPPGPAPMIIMSYFILFPLFFFKSHGI